MCVYVYETEERHTGDFESEVEVGIVIFCAADEMLLFFHQAHAYEMQHLQDMFILSSNLGAWQELCLTSW